MADEKTEPKGRKLGIIPKPVELDIQPDAPEEVMSLDSFIIVNGYSIAILHRMEIFLDGNQTDRTRSEWEAVYSNCMNRVTK